MDTIKDPESIRLLLYLTSAVLTISVIMIGYFMTRRDNSITAATDNLTNAVQQLKSIVDSLKMQHEIRQPLVDAQLELYRQTLIDNAVTVKNMDIRLVKLETEHRLFHCSYPINKTKTKKNENTD